MSMNPAYGLKGVIIMSESYNRWPRPEIIPIPVYTEGVSQHIVDLNGTWKFALNAPENFWAVDTDLKNWLDIQVPGECVMQGYDIKQDKEYAYMKQVTVPSDFTGNKIILRFDGVYSYARVWVNGAYVRDHEGGFTTWNAI